MSETPEQIITEADSEPASFALSNEAPPARRNQDQIDYLTKVIDWLAAHPEERIGHIALPSTISPELQKVTTSEGAIKRLFAGREAKVWRDSAWMVYQIVVDGIKFEDRVWSALHEQEKPKNEVL